MPNDGLTVQLRGSAFKYGWVCLFAFAVLVNAGCAAERDLSSFSIVILPDTQLYSQSFPDVYTAQATWIRQRVRADNIKFVIHLGDIVQNPELEEEWHNAHRAHQILDGVVPYSMLPGNHDMVDGTAPLYNKYFGPKRFEKNDWYAGHLAPNNDHNYCKFDVAGMKFVVLSLGYDPSTEALEWANEVCDRHADDRIIVATHEYLISDNSQNIKEDARTGIGNRIWHNLIRKHSNIFMVLCGHLEPCTLIANVNDAGGMVYQMMANYQSGPNGGNGWLRTIRFVPLEQKIYVESYSPFLEQYNSKPRHTFALTYEMPVKE